MSNSRLGSYIKRRGEIGEVIVCQRVLNPEGVIVDLPVFSQVYQGNGVWKVEKLNDDHFPPFKLKG